MINAPVLVLNQNYEPLNVCSVRRAVVLILKDKAELLEQSERTLHAESVTFPHPVVIRLVSYVRVPRDRAKTAREVAELGVKAGCEFDKNSAGPVKVHTLKLKG